MATKQCILISFGISLFGECARSEYLAQADPMPAPDGHLHIYHLPVGVGESAVIQCPDGVLGILDMGTISDYPGRFWKESQIQTFIGDNTQNVQNIVISHNHHDHFNLFPSVFNDTEALTGLQNIYVSCTAANLDPTVIDWITAIGANDKVREFNGGGQCGPVGGPCGNINICPNNPEIVYEVLAANLGQKCSLPKSEIILNMDCIVSKITYHNISLLLPADFEDETSDPDEDGPLKWMIDFYGAQLQVDYSHTAHHGNNDTCNKESWLAALSPRFVSTSGDPWFMYTFPSCLTLDHYLSLGTLCKPGVPNPADPDYCGQHVLDNPDLGEILQSTYTCFDDFRNPFEIRTDNEYAIYTVTEDFNNTNLIDVATDGNRIGIRIESIHETGRDSVIRFLWNYALLAAVSIQRIVAQFLPH